jgi:uncharacterized protein
MPDLQFDVRVRPDARLGETLVVGLTNPGLAGLTVADYLVESTDGTNVGHIRMRGITDPTPFSSGEPRYAIRLYGLPEARLTVLVSEVFLPVGAGEPFVRSLLEWVDATDISEVVVPHAVPYPHGPADHAVFFVGTEQFRERRVDDHDIRPMAGGFLDGAVGELMTTGLDRSLPVGTLITPAHPPGPDLDGALRFLGALEELYDLHVDETELEARAANLRRYYQELADRMKRVDDSAEPHEYPADRMFM